MSKKALYFPYVNKNGRTVSGTAALLHHMKEIGGVEKYNESIFESGLFTFLSKRRNLLNNNVVQHGVKKLFKKIV